jgi:hypothetical protein
MLLLATTSQPQPFPDATPTLRGAVNADPAQQLRGKTFSDKLTVAADSGVAYASTCLPRVEDLGGCPVGGGLQCVADAGWFSCQHGGWSVLFGAGGSGVSTVAAIKPVVSSGGASPSISALPAGVGDAGIVTAGAQTFSGVKTFPDGISTAAYVAAPGVVGYASNVPLLLSSNLDPGANQPTVVIDSPGVERTNGYTQQWKNNGTPYATMDTFGSLALNTLTLNGGLMTAAAGVTYRSARLIGDGSTDHQFQVKSGITRPVGVTLMDVQNPNGAAVFQVLARGEVIGGINQDSEASFIDGSASDGHATLSCSPGAGDVGGCFITLRSRMSMNNASAFHGYLTLGNFPKEEDGGINYQDGGLAIQVFGTGKSNAQSTTFRGTTFGVDDFGNVIIRDGMIFQAIKTADRIACPSTPVWDGQWKGPGGYGYDQDVGAIMLQTANSCALDGGAERVLTNTTLFYMPSILVNTTVSAATFGALLTPPQGTTLKALSFYWSASGTGGSTNVVFTGTSAGGACDFSMACDAAPGAKRLTGSGSGCNVVANDTIVWSISAVGNCTGPGSITGNVTPEAAWQ